MPDLDAIRAALARIAPYPWYYEEDSDGCVSVKDANGWEVCEVNMTRATGTANGAAIAAMPGTVVALVAEVEWLRGAIQTHRQKLCLEAGAEDHELWEVLDA